MLNLKDILYMRSTGKIKPGANLVDILWWKKLYSAVEKLVTILGNPLSFITKKAQIAKSTKVTLSPIQAGSGDPSPTNIRPISGRSSVEIKGCGKNLLDENKWDVGHYISATGEIADSTNAMLGDFIRVKENNTYVLSGTDIHKSNAGASTVYVYINAFDKNKNFLGRILADRYDASYVLSIPENCWYVRVSIGDMGTKVQFEQGSSATAYESYQQSNDISVRMIWNLFNKDDSSSIINANIPSGSSGTIPANANSRLVFIKCKPNTTYTVSKTAGARFRVATTVDVPADGVVCSQIISDNTASSITITTDATAEYLCAYVYNTTVDSGTDTEMIASVQIEEGSSASPYRQYIGDAIYGGTLDVETGVLTIDSIELKQKPNNWKKATSYDVFYYALGTTDPPYYPVASNLICNRYKTGNSVTSASGAYTRGDKTICPRGTSDNQRDRFYVRDDDYATLEDFVADISSLQIVYALPEPITIQLTPEQIQILKGLNNIWIEDVGAVMELSYMD